MAPASAKCESYKVAYLGNDEEAGEKIGLKLETSETVDTDVEEVAIVKVGTADAERMKAMGGDLIYVADKRWWLGGLRSVHAKLEVSADLEGTILIPENVVENARLRVGEQVKVEKII